MTRPTCSIEETVRLILRLLVERDYDALGRLMVGPLGLDVGEYVREAVEHYGREPALHWAAPAGDGLPHCQVVSRVSRACLNRSGCWPRCSAGSAPTPGES